jgi:type II secretory pathway component GspD/PulD (secretin)/tetratricopeptide (TPR) repeat protein
MPNAALCADGQQDRQKLIEQLVDRWMQIGMEQYERRYFKAAEQSFLMAKDYEEYLGTEQREKLNDWIEKSHIAAAGVDKLSADLAMAQQLMAEGRLAEARALFEAARDSQYLTPETRQMVEQGLAQTGGEAVAQQAEMVKLYRQSVDYYNTGELEKARAGFLEISKSGLMVAPPGSTPEDYLVKIDAALAQKIMQPGETRPAAGDIEKELFGPEPMVPEQQPMPMAVEQPMASQPTVTVVTSQPVTQVTEQPEQGGGYIEVIKRRQNILRSHTEAVVGDALAKARSYQAENQFDQATKSIEYAQNIVNKNRLSLGEEMFKRYSDELQRMRDEISSARDDYQARSEEAARITAQQEQEQIRQQMEEDRENRINELMQNALDYQKQQRYKEALGQLQSLIAIDPLNQHALIMKDTLEDTISFEEQLRVVKEKQRERANLLIETSKSEIPYPEEMTIAKNWLEISAKRVPKEAIGQDPATARVYEQLEQTVDLSELRPDMSFSEALEILRNKVDPPLKIVPLWRDLYDNADIDQSTPINMDPISSVRLGSALKFLLEAVSGGFAELDFGVENGIITIATKESIPTELITLVYDVTDLVGVPAEYRTNVSGGAGAGGGGGVTSVGGGFTDTGQEETYDREEIRQMRQQNIDDLILLIQDTVYPDTWFSAGGEGTITSYGTRMLSIRQTADIHNQVSSLLEELRKAHNYQIAIETRFLKVRENFLEEIGLDMDFQYRPGGKWGEISFSQDSATLAAATASGVEGSLAGAIASTLTGNYGTILDDLEVSFVLNATQAHGDATLITAPKATVLSGESATFRVQKFLFYAGDIQVETTEAGANVARGFLTINYEDRQVTYGTILNITPTIAPDKKHVLLDVDVQLNDFLGFRDQVVQLPVFGESIPGVGNYTIEFPETEAAQVRTRVSVPDGGTLLLGGQKLGAEIDKEAGVPVLSKIPLLGRAFSNRSKVKDHNILLIFVKPTIILQEEIEAEAVAELKNSL